MALSTAQRNALPTAAFADRAHRKFPIKKVVAGHLVPDPAHIASAKGYIRYAKGAVRSRINNAAMAQKQGLPAHAPAVARALTNAQKPLSTLMKRGK